MVVFAATLATAEAVADTLPKYPVPPTPPAPTSNAPGLPEVDELLAHEVAYAFPVASVLAWTRIP